MEVTFPDRGGVTWRLEYARQSNDDLVVWVTGMHWPGCDDEAVHKPVTFGQIRTGGDFHRANQSFWESVGIDTVPVFDAVARLIASGDPGDVMGTGEDTGSEGELP